MSTARSVPETWELTGDDARKTLRTRWRSPAGRDAFANGCERPTVSVMPGRSRSRSPSCSSKRSSRSWASPWRWGTTKRATSSSAPCRPPCPGPAGRPSLRRRPGPQAELNGRRALRGLVFGLVGALITARHVMGQVERALNRLYGVEQDRPTVQKYGRALVLALTTGALAGQRRVRTARVRRTIGESSRQRVADRLGRRPLAARAAPHDGRHHGALPAGRRAVANRRWSWLAFRRDGLGGAVDDRHVRLGAFFSVEQSFGETYGPLAGIVRAVALGAAVVGGPALRCGRRRAARGRSRRGTQPQDAEKVAHPNREASRGRPLRRWAVRSRSPPT